MSKVAIVTDSTAYLPSNLVNQHDIHVVPQVLIWGNDTYQDGINILPDEFYRKLKTATIMPTTSQVSIVTMRETFEALLEKGYDILGIFISSKLSGTMDSAIQARQMLAQSANKIALVDSQATSMAMGFHVLTAARHAESGGGLDACEQAAKEARNHTGVYFVVDTLDFLRRGGRIGGAQALLGSALNIKPILSLVDGRIEPVEKVRAKSKALDRMVELVIEKVSGRTPVRVSILHADAQAEAERLLTTITQQIDVVEKHLAPVSPVIGTHAGPGTIGLAFMAGL